jgi:DNA replication licensing factor MCM5
MGIMADRTGPQNRSDISFTPEEEEKYQAMARDPEIYDKIVKSLAPSIFGNSDVKCAIACMLFGGSRKRLPDGLTLRGDINVLLLGDPSTAKSQFLKFVERVAPISVYTSGKGSSAAGLTASVIKDANTGEF